MVLPAFCFVLLNCPGAENIAYLCFRLKTCFCVDLIGFEQPMTVSAIILCIWAEPMRDDVTSQRRLSLAEPIHKMMPECWWNLKSARNLTWPTYVQDWFPVPVASHIGTEFTGPGYLFLQTEKKNRSILYMLSRLICQYISRWGPWDHFGNANKVFSWISMCFCFCKDLDWHPVTWVEAGINEKWVIV